MCTNPAPCPGLDRGRGVDVGESFGKSLTKFAIMWYTV